MYILNSKGGMFYSSHNPSQMCIFYLYATKCVTHLVAHIIICVFAKNYGNE